MLLLWLMVLGVCGDVALSMEGPRGKVTREMCSKPPSQVPEEDWPYCCEGYGKLCEDFAASCYLDCQPVVSSGSDVTLVEERPGFCCALYNFCCSREFSRIGNLQEVEVEEQFPTFHRFHIPEKQAPRRSAAPRKNIVRQEVNNDISVSPRTVNRVGRPRTPSRNNGPRERLDQIDSKSSKSLDEVVDNFSFDVSRSEQQESRFNSLPNVVKPQRSSKPNVKPKRNQVRFPQRPQIDKTKNTETPITSEIPISNIQSDDSFVKIAPTKKTEIKAKIIENSEDNKNNNQNSQQLNREDENRKITINRAGVNRRDQLRNTNENQKVSNEDDQEFTPTNQPKSVSLPTINESQPKTNAENSSENKQVKEEKTHIVTTEQPTTRRQNNGRKVKMGRRVIVRTAPKKISKNEQESSKSIDSEQSKSEVKPTASRRTIINNRQTQKTIKNNEQVISKSTDSVQSRQEAKPTAGRRTIISNRQTQKTIKNNEQVISKSTDSVQSRQEANPTAGRRTIISDRQTQKIIKNNEQVISKSTDSVQSRQEANPTAGRRTIISNRQSPKKIINNEQDISKSMDSAQSRQEINLTSSRRTILSNRQNTKKISNNEQDILKSSDPVQSRQEVKPTASRRTILSNRQTGLRRSRPAVSSTKESTRTETNQEESNASDRSGGRNRGRRVKQTLRRVIPENTQRESVKLATSTTNEKKEDLPIQKINITNKPVTEQIAPVASNIENKDEIMKGPKNEQLEKMSDVRTSPSNTDKTSSFLPLSKEGVEAPKLDLDSSASQISEDQNINQNDLKISEQEKENLKDETETKSPQDIDENTIVTETYENTQSPFENAKANEVNENQKEIENSSSNSNNPKQTRSRSRTTIPEAVINIRNKATPSTGENSAITNSRTRSRSRSSRTRNQDPTLQEETISTATTNRGATRIGRKDVSKSTVQKSPINTENTSRQTTRRRGRQPT